MTQREIELPHQDSWASLLSRTTSSSSLANDELLKLFDEDTTDRCWKSFGSCLDAAAIEGPSSIELPPCKTETTTRADFAVTEDKEVPKPREQQHLKHGGKRLKLPKLKREHQKEVYASDEEPIAKRTRRHSVTQNGTEPEFTTSAPVKEEIPQILTAKISRKFPARLQKKRNKFTWIKRKKRLHCICRTPDHGTYVGCDSCKGWFHPQCVGISEKEAKEMNEFFCPGCVRAYNPTHRMSHRPTFPTRRKISVAKYGRFHCHHS